MQTLTLEQYIQQFSGCPWDDGEYASSIVDRLPERLPLTRAAAAFLEARRTFENELDKAGIERG